jgi:hypothetical protein
MTNRLKIRIGLLLGYIAAVTSILLLTDGAAVPTLLLAGLL